MATITTTVCDTDPDHGEAETVPFGAGTEFFTADLCKECRDQLTKAQESFAAVGTPVSVKDLIKHTQAAFDPAVVRAWAQRNGKKLGDRGRIPAEYVEEWRADTGNQLPS